MVFLKGYVTPSPNIRRKEPKDAPRIESDLMDLNSLLYLSLTKSFFLMSNQKPGVMKRLAMITLGLFMTSLAMSQAVHDRNVVPVAVNLNQVLRMTIYDGGNVEFTFNTIQQYRNGINSGGGGAANYYNTEFTVSSSTPWILNYGAEDANLIGVDSSSHTLALNNVGWSINAIGTHVFGTELDASNANGIDQSDDGVTFNTDISALHQYPTEMINDHNLAGQRNAGDATDNSFVIAWRCGTTEPAADAADAMNATNLLNQSPSPMPDRYVTNVLFELVPRF